ncbi:MAG TPA: M20/M25/M40 family metallo-hydrolase [Bryobacteraceae bacterium]|nr:M20/M25/M40 family metallo-hydrolase [Bryobacteraceae bacterium]
MVFPSNSGFPKWHSRLTTRLPVVLLLLTANLPAQTARPDPAIQQIVAEISPDRIAATVKTLAGFETRGNYSDPNQKTRGIGAARRWIFAQLHGYNQRLEVSYDVEKKGATDIASVVAVLPGTVQPEKRIIVAAHYDSINLRATGDKAAEAPAPGADDDASGTAVVLELARVLSRYHFRKTIVFIAFAGEELGFVGSSRYASRAKASHEQIEAVFNNDIVGSDVVGEASTHTGIALNDIGGADDDTGGSGETGNRLRIYSPDPADSPSRRLARYIQDAAQRYVPILQIELILRSDRYTRGGDQIPFQRSGFAAVRLTSASENLISQHTMGDTPDRVSSSFTANVARVNGAAIAGLAAAAPETAVSKTPARKNAVPKIRSLPE